MVPAPIYRKKFKYTIYSSLKIYAVTNDLGFIGQRVWSIETHFSLKGLEAGQNLNEERMDILFQWDLIVRQSTWILYLLWKPL